jgi:myo-inositol-1(or 4)-monophosphatase
MKPVEIRQALSLATDAARGAGAVLRANLRSPKEVHLASRHDIKLELDVRCQRLIEQHLRRGRPDVAILGEEESHGDAEAEVRWVVDPIDGTVNFAHGIPHACVCIALQRRVAPPSPDRPADDPVYADGFATELGVVFDPFADELWTATATGPARLNGRVTRVHPRKSLADSIVMLGFAKTRRSLEHMQPIFLHLVHRVRKLRIMGSAALATTYVASGRFDAYLESGVRLWDIAAAGLILQRAGGVFWRREIGRDRSFEIVFAAPPLHPRLLRLARGS